MFKPLLFVIAGACTGLLFVATAQAQPGPATPYPMPRGVLPPPLPMSQVELPAPGVRAILPGPFPYSLYPPVPPTIAGAYPAPPLPCDFWIRYGETLPFQPGSQASGEPGAPYYAGAGINLDLGGVRPESPVRADRPMPRWDLH